MPNPNDFENHQRMFLETAMLVKVAEPPWFNEEAEESLPFGKPTRRGKWKCNADLGIPGSIPSPTPYLRLPPKPGVVRGSKKVRKLSGDPVSKLSNA